MMEQRSALYWSRGEQRITSELKMSDVNVISYAGTPFAAMNMEDELKRAAESQRADFAFFLYKTGLQNVRLMIYATPSTDDAQEYTTYDFQLDTTEESENIVALKAAEAVLAVMKIETRESAPPSNPDQTPAPSSVKLAIALAIAGAISVGVGIGFHYQKMIHEQDATDYSNQMNATYADRYPPEYDALRSQYSESMDATKTARARAVAGYVIGGALLSVSAAPVFAQAILNIWNGTSVSSLFEDSTLSPIYESLYQMD